MATTFDLAALKGLSAAEARRRLREDGPNELPRRGGEVSAAVGSRRTATHLARADAAWATWPVSAA